jgi:hypothetical protein
VCESQNRTLIALKTGRNVAVILVKELAVSSDRWRNAFAAARSLRQAAPQHRALEDIEVAAE